MSNLFEEMECEERENLPKIWTLLSVANAYDQPNNNLVAWWMEKPSFEVLAAAMDITFEGEENILNTVYIHQGQARRVGSTDFRLVQLLEGQLYP